jgi:5-methylcytosine-specific restriction enzyme subunit McrC
VTDVPVSALPWDKVVLDRTNAAWHALLRLARLLLGDRFQNTSIGLDQGFSLLFQMNTLFEEFIGRTLRRALASAGLNVSLQGPQDHALVAEDGARRFATRPDVVVKRQSAPALILDTKWKRLSGSIDDPKRGVSQADVYQMMAYAQVYGCRRLVLPYPHHQGLGEEAGVLVRHEIRRTVDTHLAVASVSLSDFATIGVRLRELVSAEIASPTSIGAA